MHFLASKAKTVASSVHEILSQTQHYELVLVYRDPSEVTHFCSYFHKEVSPDILVKINVGGDTFKLARNAIFCALDYAIYRQRNVKLLAYDWLV